MIFGYLFYSLGCVQVGTVDDAEDILDVLNELSTETVAHHADGIWPVQAEGLAALGYLGKRQNVLANDTVAADISIAADTHELVNRAKSA